MTSRAPIGPGNTPFDMIGQEAAVALAERFYDHMDAHEPALVAVHRTNEAGDKVAPVVRERFGAFLVEWLGGLVRQVDSSLLACACGTCTSRSASRCGMPGSVA